MCLSPPDNAPPCPAPPRSQPRQEYSRCAANETSIPKAAPGGRKEGREAGDKGRNTQGLTSTLRGDEALNRGTI
ncbi:hypothetical protein E2C01_003564 [Portunus trituberculatus]|uniref:Uncharacterized protein n=1 Tax=Portunus trituberculatus TaxID=210409 RepID=A0A5B7CN43_PORTR|nr:hypothetical protein [Portunus trituberculatus]